MNRTASRPSTELIEEGSAFLRLTAPPAPQPEPHEVVVIGAGQTGLSVGYYLKQLGVPFVIIDAEQRVGDVWRKRWDSLRLFTAARFDGLAGFPFPATKYSFPTKDEMADYLEAYARRFELPLASGVRVERLTRQGDRYLVECGPRRFTARHVVVAMASYQKPRVPEYARELDRGIVQIHSVAYRNPSQLREGPVLIVGAGNSGAEIALDVAPRHQTVMAGRDVGFVPFRINGPIAKRIALPLVLRVIFHRILTLSTPIGRRLHPKLVSQGGPLIRTKPADLARAGVRRAPRMTGVRDGKPLLADGSVLDVANVIWATGFHPGFSWIDLPVLDAHGEPEHVRGVVVKEPGLYFVGLHFLYALSSTMIHGANRDAGHIARVIARRRTAAS